MRKALLVAALPLAMVAATLTAAGAASAATSKAAYSWHVADPVVDAAGSPPVAIAMASNGETIELDNGVGLLDAGDKTASGGGTIVHKAPDGSVIGEGTLTVNGLVSFQFYGCSDQVLPGVTLCGGLAKLDVTLTPAGTSLEFPGTLWVDCLIGDKIPAGGEPARHEGIRLNVPGVANFNKTVHSGFTVFLPA